MKRIRLLKTTVIDGVEIPVGTVLMLNDNKALALEMDERVEILNVPENRTEK